MDFYRDYREIRFNATNCRRGQISRRCGRNAARPWRRRSGVCQRFVEYDAGTYRRLRPLPETVSHMATTEILFRPDRQLCEVDVVLVQPVNIDGIGFDNSQNYR